MLHVLLANLLIAAADEAPPQATPSTGGCARADAPARFCAALAASAWDDLAEDARRDVLQRAVLAELGVVDEDPGERVSRIERARRTDAGAPSRITEDVGTSGTTVQGGAVPDVRPVETVGATAALTRGDGETHAVAALAVNLHHLLFPRHPDQATLSRLSDITVSLPFRLDPGEGEAPAGAVAVRQRINLSAFVLQSRLRSLSRDASDLGDAARAVGAAAAACAGADVDRAAAVASSPGTCPGLIAARDAWDRRREAADVDASLARTDRDGWGIDWGAMGRSDEAFVDARLAGTKALGRDPDRYLSLKGSAGWTHHLDSILVEGVGWDTRATDALQVAAGVGATLPIARTPSGAALPVHLDVGAILTTSFMSANASTDMSTDRADLRLSARAPFAPNVGVALNVVQPIANKEQRFEPTFGVAVDWVAMARLRPRPATEPALHTAWGPDGRARHAAP